MFKEVSYLFSLLDSLKQQVALLKGSDLASKTPSPFRHQGNTTGRSFQLEPQVARTTKVTV